MAEHHPSATFSALIVDDDGSIVEDREPFRVIRPSDLHMEKGDFERLALSCERDGLLAAMTPLFLAELLAREPRVTWFLAPHQRVYGSLEHLEDLIRKHPVGLVPRRRQPLPLDSRTPDDADLFSAGSIESACLVVGPGCESFLSWLWERLVGDGLAYDAQLRRLGQLQPHDPARWLDLAPTYFDCTLLSDPGLNVGFWNLEDRHVQSSGGRNLVDGHPLRTFNFDGYDPGQPFLLSARQGPKPRVLLSEQSGVAELCQRYSDELDENGYTDSVEYGFDVLPNGLRIDRRIRFLYREALAEELLSEEPPNPFIPGDEDRFLDWLRMPVAGQDVSRYLLAVYTDRTDLQATYRDPSAPGFLDWVVAFGQEEEGVPSDLLPQHSVETVEPAGVRSSQPATQGVNVVGFTKAEVGLGAASRLLIDALRRGGVPYTTISLSHPFAPDKHEMDPGEADVPYDVNVICGTPDLTEAVIRRVGTQVVEGRYNVGLWFWEAQDFSTSTRRGFKLVDEIWAPTEYIAKAIRGAFQGPVEVFPVPLGLPAVDATVTREELGLPEGFLFLFVYDYSSVFERKNPLGLVEAYKRAFGPDEGPTLILKSMFAERHLVSSERLRYAMGNRPDIRIIDGVWPAERKNALIGLCDCYVSLHRSEGLGLTMAEAMALGKPTIATAYSGNLDFMTENNSYLVRHRMTKVGEGSEPYDPDWEWADPDLDHAASLMRHVFEDQAEAHARGERARRDLLESRPLERTARFVSERLVRIRERGQTVDARIRRTTEGGDQVDQPATEAPDAERRARELIERGVDRSAPTKFGALGRLMRRVVLFFLRPYDRHQREVHWTILDAVHEARVERKDSEP